MLPTLGCAQEMWRLNTNWQAVAGKRYKCVVKYVEDKGKETSIGEADSEVRTEV